jgi:hypothetical protein
VAISILSSARCAPPNSVVDDIIVPLLCYFERMVLLPGPPHRYGSDTVPMRDITMHRPLSGSLRAVLLLSLHPLSDPLIHFGFA